MKSNIQPSRTDYHQPLNEAPLNNRTTNNFDDELVTVKEITAVLRIGNTKWWEGVRAGKYPQPVKLGSRCTRWHKSAITQLMKTGV